MAESGFQSSRRRKKSAAAAVDVNDPTLLASLGYGALSGLQYLGETLNKPSRALWGSVNYLTGGEAGGGLLNLLPFSDTLGWTDPRKGVELSHVVDRTGILPENQAGFDRWDVARFGLDLIGDPTTYIGPGLAGKVGQVAKKAGVLPDALRAGRLGKGLGPRVTGMETTLLGALDTAGDAGRHAEAWEAAAKAAGGRDALQGMLDKPLGSALTFGIPFTGINTNIGTGRFGRGLAKAMDYPGQMLMGSAVGRYGRQLFDPAVKGEFDPAAQAMAETAFYHEKSAAKQAAAAVQESQKIHKEGFGEVENFMSQVDAGTKIPAKARGWATMRPGQKVIVDDLQGEIGKVSPNSYSIFHRDPQSGATRTIQVLKSQLDRIRPVDDAGEAGARIMGPERLRVEQEAVAAFGDKAPEVLKLYDAYAENWGKAQGLNPDDLFRRIKVKSGTLADVGADALEQPVKLPFGARGATPEQVGNLSRANEMLSAGSSADEILESTGWYKGDDGKWRIDVTGEDLVFKSMDWKKPKRLGDVMDSPWIYSAYPDLANYKIADAPKNAKYGAVIDTEKKIIRVPESAKADPKSLQEALAHEFTHHIQEAEGFAGGAAPDYMTSKGIGEQLKDLSKAVSEMTRQKNAIWDPKKAGYGYSKREGNLPMEFVRDNPDYDKWVQLESDIESLKRIEGQVRKAQKYHNYMMSPGEIEARKIDGSEIYDEAAGLNLVKKWVDHANEYARKHFGEFLGDSGKKPDVLYQGPNLDALRFQMPDTPKVNAMLDEIEGLVKSGKGVSDSVEAEKLIRQASGVMYRKSEAQLDRAWNKWTKPGEQIDDALGKIGAVEPGDFVNFDRAFDVAGPQIRKVLGDAEKIVQEAGFKATAQDLLAEARKIADAGEADSITHAVYQATAKVMNEDAFYERFGKIVGDNLQDVLYQPRAKEGGARAAVEFKGNEAIITAFEKADISSFIHEGGHIFQKFLGEVSPQLAKEAESALGVVSGQWTREAKELFASGFERYLKDGQAPTKGLASVFAKAREWMASIYASIVGTPLAKRVNPKLRRVFDKMLTNPDVATSKMVARSRAWTVYDQMTRAISEGMPWNVAWESVRKKMQLPKGTPLPDHVRSAMEIAGDKLKVQRDALFETAKKLGATSDDMKTFLGGAQHFPRQTAKKVQDEIDELMGFSPIVRNSGSTKAGSYKGRTEEIRNSFTMALNEMLGDKRVKEEGKDRILEYVQDGKLELDPNWGVGKNPDEVFNPAQIDELARIDAEKQAGTISPDDAVRLTGDVHRTAHAEALATWSRDHAQKAMFTRDVAADQMTYLQSVHRAIASKMAIHDVVAASVRDAAELLGETGGGTMLSDVFRRAGMEPGAAMAETAKRLGKTPDEIAQMAVPDDVAKAIVGVQKLTQDMPKWKKTFLAGYDKVLRLFKESVTTQVAMPSYFGRNALSGLFQNFASGEIKTAGDIKSYFAAMKEAWDPKGPLADEIGAVFGQDELFGELADVRGDAIIGTLGLEGQTIPKMRSVKEVWRETAERVALEPSGIAGFDPVRKVYGTNTKIGQEFNAIVEWQNRVPMYVYLRKKGFVPDAAKAIVDKVQFDYRGGLSQFEKDWMRRLMPFYSFSKLNAKFLAEDLLSNPGGLSASLLKSQAGRGAASPDTPDWVASGVAADLGEDEEGNKTFLAGLGLPFEDTARFVGHPLSDSLSRLNPAIKGVLEWGTGRSFFQSGRDLREQDPSLGRLLGNLGVLSGIRDSKDPVSTPAILEQFIVNTPVSKALNTAKSLTDTRKSGGEKAIQYLTGVRLNTVSPSLRAATIQQRVDEAARNLGARPYTRFSFPKQEGVELTPEQTKVKNIYSALAAAAKERKKAREQSERVLKGIVPGM